MEDQYKEDILNELNITGLSSIDKDLEGMNRVLKLKGKDLTSLTDRKLSECQFITTQHQIYLQLCYNVRYVEYLKAKRKYELALNKEVSKIEGKQTIKEKTAQVMEKKYLIELEEELSKCESRYTLLNKMPEAFVELANAIKKEMSIRNKGINK